MTWSHFYSKEKQILRRTQFFLVFFMNMKFEVTKHIVNL